jgi:predicted histone-like DNA-binding protein
MKYRLVERKNPQRMQGTGKLYASPVKEGRVSQKEITTEIAALSSLSCEDVNSVIDRLPEIVPKYLVTGKSVSLGNLGTLRITFSSEGAPSEEAFDVGMISGVRVLFTPSALLRRSIEDITFEKA